LALYRRLLAERRGSAALQRGSLVLDAPVDGVVGFARSDGDDHRRVLVNFTDQPVAVMPAGTDASGSIVAVSTHRDHEGAAFTGTLAPDEAVVLRARVG